MKGTAEVLAGTQMIETYAAFDQKGYLFPGFVTLHEIILIIIKCTHTIEGGTCPTVGVGGFVLGGGYGFFSRKYGLAIDNLLEIEIVVPTGTGVSFFVIVSNSFQHNS